MSPFEGDRLVKMYSYNLVLVNQLNHATTADLLTIRHMMAGRAPDIDVILLDPGSPLHDSTRSHIALRPTLIFSRKPVRLSSPVRGRLLAGQDHTKIQEVKLLASKGLNVPDAVLVTPDLAIDPSSWGPWTVLKPNRGLQGRGVVLCPTSRVRWIDPASWPAGDPRHGQDLVAQQFVNTGRFAASYRVMTVLGQPVYSIISRALNATPDLTLAGSGDLNLPIAANNPQRIIELAYDQDVISLAREVHRHFPDIPVLGVDMVRDVATGALFVLEINARGGTWHLSSPHGLSHQRQYGLDMYGQFGALDVITNALTKATRERAE